MKIPEFIVTTAGVKSLDVETFNSWSSRVTAQSKEWNQFQCLSELSNTFGGTFSRQNEKYYISDGVEYYSFNLYKFRIMFTVTIAIKGGNGMTIKYN